MTSFFVPSPCLSFSLFLMFFLSISNVVVYVFYASFSAQRYFFPNDLMSVGNFTYYAVLPQEIQTEITLYGFDYFLIQGGCVGLLLGSFFGFLYVAYVRFQIASLIHIFGMIVIFFFDCIRTGWFIWVIQDGSKFWYYFTPGYVTTPLKASTEFTIMLWVSVYSLCQSVVQMVLHLVIKKSYDETKDAEQMNGIMVSSSISKEKTKNRGGKKRKEKNSEGNGYDNIIHGTTLIIASSDDEDDIDERYPGHRAMYMSYKRKKEEEKDKFKFDSDYDEGTML